MNTDKQITVDEKTINENEDYMMDVFTELANQADVQLCHRLCETTVRTETERSVHIVICDERNNVVRNIYAHRDVIDIAVEDLRLYETYETPHTSELGQVLTSSIRKHAVTYHFAYPLRDKAVIDEALRIAYAVIGVEKK